MLHNNTTLLIFMLLGLTTSRSFDWIFDDDDDEKDHPIVEFVAGGFIFLCSFCILCHNEYKAAKNQTSISEAKKQCIHIDHEYIDPTYEGKLVHINGEAFANDVIYFKKFGVEASESLYLERVVETYQWVEYETEKRLGKRTIQLTRYEKQWKETAQYSDDYDHENDMSFWTVKHKKKFAKNVNVGAYLLSKSLLRQGQRKRLMSPKQKWISSAEASYPNRKQPLIYIKGNTLYFSQSETEDTIGDQRIQFYYVPCGEVTVVSKIKGNTFEPFLTNIEAKDQPDDHLEREGHSSINVPDDFENITDNERSDNLFLESLKYIHWLMEYKFSKDEIFDFKLTESQLLAWQVRLFGFTCVVAGLFIMFSPVVWIISWFPSFGNFLASLSTFLFYCISVLIAIPITLLTISIAWIRFHPIKGLILLLSGVCFGLVLWLLIAKS